MKRAKFYIRKAKVSWNFIDPGHRVRDEDINRKLPIGSRPVSPS